MKLRSAFTDILLYIKRDDISILIRPECVSVCAWEISEQLNQENGKSYGTGFFDKVQI